MAAKLKPRLPSIPDPMLSDRQKELMESIRSGPRGRVSQGGPFGVYLHAPDFGDLTQKRRKKFGPRIGFNAASGSGLQT